jgi:O-antigen/teichoic acid export membrane protein
MLLVMGVSLYTSRVILAALGVIDFGIFNVVAGMTTMFAFFQSSLSNATQRFLNFELGKNNIDQAQNIFNISSLIYFCLSIGVAIIAEIVGLWLIYHKLNIPPERLSATIWVFHATVISLFVTLNAIVFQSVLIARENMKVYAYIGLFEALGRLSIALAISYSSVDKLILYSILFTVLSISVQLLYAAYCKTHYEECKYRFYWNRQVFSKMFSFVGWNGVGTAVYAINFQGINIVLNIFFGPVVNAARAVSAQVETAVNNFTSNFYTAVRPQIIKSYAAEDYTYFTQLMFSSGRYAFYLMLVLCIPIQFRIDEILVLWLGEPPLYSGAFVHWVLIYSAINVLTNPFWTAIQAIGHLKKYCLLGGVVFLSAFPISYLLLLRWENPILVFIVLAIVRFIYVFVTMFIIREYVDFSIRKYLKQVIYPISFVSAISVVVCYGINILLPHGILYLVIACVLFPCITMFTIYTIGISSQERAFVQDKIVSVLRK